MIVSGIGSCQSTYLIRLLFHIGGGIIARKDVRR
jgi:hypothetical protein